MSGANSLTFTDPVSKEIHVHWYEVTGGKVRVVHQKDGFSISSDYSTENLTVIRDFIDAWLEQDLKRRGREEAGR